MKKYQAALMAGSSAFVLMLGHTTVATAQTTPAASGQVETVIVTARKRSEDILKVPVAVSALTGNDLAKRDIDSISDLANFSPGLTVDQSIGGDARSDRSFQSIIIRGMVESTTANPTTSVFINGAPVASADFLQNLTDVDHVEVLKGPQSAYFGRETFAGAINVTAKSATNTLGGQISADIGTRRTEKFSGVINVPIIDDKLAVRAGYDYDSHDGSYKNAYNPGQTLGDQASKTVHLAITARPIDHLTIKAFGMVFQDHDGPAATGILLAQPTNAAFKQSNCVVSGTPWFCGTLPGLLSVSPAQNTTIVPGVNFANLSRAYLANPGDMFHGDDDFVGRFGLKRNAYHGDLNVQYDVPSLGLTLTYIGAYNHDNWSELSDLYNEDAGPGGQYPGTPGYPFLVEESQHDTSHEFRIATDSTKPYRGLLGVSYVDSYVNERLGVVQYSAPGISVLSNPNEAETTGVFFALAYDILPKLTINFDGRYQQDKETLYTPTTAVKVASGTTNAFLPRVSLQYKITPDVMTYFTYSEGVNPAAYNISLLTTPQQSLNALTALGFGTPGVFVKPENITNYELGLKGRFFDGRATLSADIYYDKWTNQLVANTYNFAANDPNNPFNVNVPGNTAYNPANHSIDPFSFTSNNAESTAKGIEVEANFIVFDHFSVNLSGAINDTEYDKYICTNCLPYPQNSVTGFNAKGKQLPNSPKDSFTGGVEYANKAPIFGDADWFARLDYVYREGVYIQASNTVKTPDINLVNVRAGLNFDGGHVSVEGYINNLTNDKSYVSGFQGPEGNNAAAPNSAVLVGLPQLITGGVRLKYKY